MNWMSVDFHSIKADCAADPKINNGMVSYKRILSPKQRLDDDHLSKNS